MFTVTLLLHHYPFHTEAYGKTLSNNDIYMDVQAECYYLDQYSYYVGVYVVHYIIELITMRQTYTLHQ